MSLGLAIVLLILALVHARFVREPDEPHINIGPPFLLGATACALIAALQVFRLSDPQLGLVTTSFLVIGAAAATLGSALERRASGISSFAVGAGAAILLQLIPTPMGTSPLPVYAAMVMGAGLTSIALASSGAVVSALGGAAVALASVFGTQAGLDTRAINLGAVLATFAVAVPVGLIPILRQSSKDWIAAAVAVALVAAGFVTGRLMTDEMGVFLSVAAGAVGGFALQLLVPASRAQGQATGRILLAAFLTIAVASVAFSLARGHGMALALIAMAAVPLSVGNYAAMSLLSLPLALIAYRLVDGGVSGRAINLDVHQVALGLLVGTLIPPAIAEWSGFSGTFDRQVTKRALGSAILCLLAVAVFPIAFVLFSERAATSILIGCAAGGVVSAVLNAHRPIALGVVACVCGTALLATPWLIPFGDLTRDQKVQTLAWSAVGVATLLCLMAALTAMLNAADQDDHVSERGPTPFA